MSESQSPDIMEITLGPCGDYLTLKATAGENGDMARDFIKALGVMLSGPRPVLFRNRLGGEGIEEVSRTQPNRMELLASEDAAQSDSARDVEKSKCRSQS